MSKLKLIYLDIQPDVKTIFVTPSIDRTKNHNSYLYLLYKDLINETEIDVKSLRAPHFPKLVLDRFRGKESILHHHWYGFHDLKSFLILVWTMVWMGVYKLFGGKIVWTVHNRLPHSKCFVKANKVVRRLFARFVDKIHVHCEKAIEIMQPLFNIPVEKYFVLEHPAYDVKLLDKMKASDLLIKKYSDVKKIINRDSLFLVFGAISSYKGVPEIIDVFNGLDGESDCALLIAGRCGNQKLQAEIDKKSEDNANIVVIKGLIPEEDIDLFFNSTDYVLFNYKDILTSGGAALAMSYGKEIIVPNLGCLSSLVYSKCTKFNKLNVEVIKKCLS